MKLDLDALDPTNHEPDAPVATPYIPPDAKQETATPRTDLLQLDMMKLPDLQAIALALSRHADIERGLAAANESLQFEIGAHKFTHEQLADERKAREEAL